MLCSITFIVVFISVGSKYWPIIGKEVRQVVCLVEQGQALRVGVLCVCVCMCVRQYTFMYIHVDIDMYILCGCSYM